MTEGVKNEKEVGLKKGSDGRSGERKKGGRSEKVVKESAMKEVGNSDFL